MSKLFEKPPFFQDSKNIQFLSEKQDLEENLDPLKVLFVLSI